MNVHHFDRTFKQSTGIVPHQYVIQQRIERAKVLLTTTTELPVSDIAAQLGFCDQSHLTTLFERAVGVTPREYRNSR